MATKGKFPANLFKGKESMSEELKEAKAIKSGKITPMQYAKGEKSEEKKKPNPFAKKRFAIGGPIETDDSGKINDEDLSVANASDDPIQTLADRKEAKKKPSIVTKEELDKSGLSLRDYMNKQQGLTRRGEKTTQPSSGGSGRGGQGGPTADELESYRSSAEGKYRKADAEARTPSRKAAMAAQAEADGLENMSADFIGGPWKLAAGAAAAGLGALGLKQMMKRGAKGAAEGAGRAVATKIDDVEFLGRSGARKMGSDAARVGADDAAKAITNSPTPRLSGPARQLSAPANAADEVAEVVASRAKARTAKPAKPKAEKKPRLSGAAKKKADQDILKGDTLGDDGFKRGGSVARFAKGGSVRGGGIAQRGIGKGRMC